MQPHHLYFFAQDIRIQFILSQSDAPLLVLTDERYHSDILIGSYVVACMLAMAGHSARD